MQNDNPLISVIVPIFNIEQYVGYCIESIVKQTYKNLEIILVDDGSTDRSSDICDLYASKDKRIKVIHKQNGGLVSARKAGVKEAIGQYIGYVDGDDWVEPFFYETLLHIALKDNADIVCAGFSRDLFHHSIGFENNITCGVYKDEKLDSLQKKMLTFDDSFTFGITTYVWNKFFKSEIVKPVQESVDEHITIGEDAAVTYPAILDSTCISICDNTSYHYRQREGSMLKLHNDFLTETEQIKRLYYYLMTEFKNRSMLEQLCSQLDDFILGYFILRSGGILGKEKATVFGVPFDGKKVAIVLAGTFGQAIYNRIMTINYCSIVGWYDDDYWEYRRSAMNVDPIDEMLKVDFDYAVIAKVERNTIKTIRVRLEKLGIPEKKVLFIDSYNLYRKVLLHEYLDIN